MTRRKPNQYNWSALRFDETILKKHFTAPRRQKLQFIVVHHMAIVGNGSGSANDTCYRVWQTRQASAHYGVDGVHVRQFVWDSNAAWATGHTTGNHAGISIEHANSGGASKGWSVSTTTWKTGARLAAQLHFNYKLGRPRSNAKGTSGTLRQHSAFNATACPGGLSKIWDDYVKEAQRQYDILVGAVAPPSKVKTHTVKRGDTLSAIAAKYKVTVANLAAWNNIKNVNIITVGDKLRVQPPAPPAKPARWFEARFLNMWGDDGSVGTNTFQQRLPSMVADLTNGDPEVVSGCEVRKGAQASALTKALNDRGYVGTVADGNFFFVKKQHKQTHIISNFLPDEVQGAGRKEAVLRVRALMHGSAANFAISHLDFRNATKKVNYDQLRCDQARAILDFMVRMAIRHPMNHWKSRTIIALDENSKAWVRDKTMKPAKFKPAVKDNIDAQYVGNDRPVLRSYSLTTQSDHPIVGAVYGRMI